MAELDEILERLAEPFDPSEVKWKPATVSGARALALCYIDARVIQDRLDDVLGVINWQDTFELLPDGSCIFKLSLRLNGEWVTKMDVGGQSEQPDEGDRHKAAVSDGLKRAAVKFGIGRYLYRLPHQWVDYDPAKKRFAREPQLPAWALPKARAAAPTPAKNGNGKTAPDAVAEWRKYLASDPTLDALNTKVPEIASLDGETKKAVKGMLLAHAERAGLAFDKPSMMFVRQPAGGAA